ncbi:MAG: class I SAM-dependent methyltransferase [Sphingobacteriaceae bacterium]|nr:class I SAM-dependent methyltransferase [Sphingobacteriaceae bacterium]
MKKTETNNYWNERAKTVENDLEVNIMDVFQRNLEYDYIIKYLEPSMHLLEVGCGMGISTNLFRDKVKWVDAFDYETNMIDRAKTLYGEKNNKFIHDNILEPKLLTNQYDAITCVRVLINLANFNEQKTAILNMTKLLKKGGKLILVEGFNEGFYEMNKLRKELNLSDLVPAKINYYSNYSEIKPLLEENYSLVDEFHLGAYDYLTRVVYPTLVGENNVKHNTSFSEKSEQLARAFNPDDFKHLSRIRGLVLVKK